jgi:hypothetical protein
VGINKIDAEIDITPNSDLGLKKQIEFMEHILYKIE